MEIHVITDGEKTVDELVEVITEFHQEADYIHIREKTKTVKELVQLVTRLIDNGIDKRKLVINDRLDVALMRDIPNIHLPGHSFSIKEVKTNYPEMRVGSSIHSVEEAIQCEAEGADYLLFGHIFATNSKMNLPGRGIQELEKVCRAVNIPVIAIGGITPEKKAEISTAKAAGMAVMSYVLSSDNPKEAARKLKLGVK
ncbi:thiazole tautomerase TenI [Metabacillus fastidiosus]|uniref:thiazole tautomerase TenI n=1 Tax=Metabacillus fastidiosus TaxID=1458 RepID=UPI003D2D1546